MECGKEWIGSIGHTSAWGKCATHARMHHHVIGHCVICVLNVCHWICWKIKNPSFGGAMISWYVKIATWCIIPLFGGAYNTSFGFDFETFLSFFYEANIRLQFFKIPNIFLYNSERPYFNSVSACSAGAWVKRKISFSQPCDVSSLVQFNYNCVFDCTIPYPSGVCVVLNRPWLAESRCFVCLFSHAIRDIPISMGSYLRC